MLKQHPGATIVYDLRASWAVRDTVEQPGGTALENRVGHAFIKARIRKEDAVFAGEVSGHYYFKDFYYCDTGMVPALVLLELVSRSGKKLSELLAPFREQYFISGEINSTVDDVPVRAADAEGHATAKRQARLAPGRHLVRVRRLALQRAAVEHRAAAAPEPRGAVGGRDGVAPRRGARTDPVVTVTERATAVSVLLHDAGRDSTRPMPRASSTTAATCRTSIARGSSTCGTSVCWPTARAWPSS